MPKTMTTQDDYAIPCPSHSPTAKQDQNKNTPPFTLTAPTPCDPSIPLPRDNTSHAGCHHLLENCKRPQTDTCACERIAEWRTRLRHVECKTRWRRTRMVDPRDGAKCCMGQLRE